MTTGGSSADRDGAAEPPPEPVPPQPGQRASRRGHAAVWAAAGAAAAVLVIVVGWMVRAGLSDPTDELLVVEPESSFAELEDATWLTKCFRGSFPRDETTDERPAGVRAASCSGLHEAKLVGGAVDSVTIYGDPGISRENARAACARYSDPLPEGAVLVTVVSDAADSGDRLCLAVRADGAPFPGENPS